MVDRIPVSVVKEMGADIIIAVDISHINKNAEITSIYDVIMQSLDIMQMELVEHRQIASDVMIRPKVEKYSSRSFTNIDEIIMIGEEEAQKHISHILKTIEQWRESHQDERP